MKPITKKYLAYKYHFPRPLGNPLFWYRAALGDNWPLLRARSMPPKKAALTILSNCIYGLPTTCMKGDITNVGKSEERPGNNG